MRYQLGGGRGGYEKGNEKLKNMRDKMKKEGILREI
jgi:hypothetical protein